ncbi:MAG: dihydroneopterin aldolase [Bacteroidales bacterium]|nr:dihydroneopterin aldolase [Bacteroidales bacterium]HOK98561.1 dihydroneopterin aldolase [Bacteroidales bacterium]HPO64812.1 dihydroneopterin aldolase [Bacteroidales bacterium]
MCYIELEEMEFFAYHGCFPEEKLVGNNFLVSFGYCYDIQRAAVSDNIVDALDYQNIYNIIKEEMDKPVNLLEYLATRILDRIFYSFPHIEKARIKITKMNPSLGGKMKGVSILLEKER